MQEAVPTGEGSMAAILGIDASQVAKACIDAAAETGVVVAPANINTPAQVAISGAVAAVDRAMALAKERGARKVVHLAVSAPFHCPLMQPAQDRLAILLRDLRFATASVPVAVNVDATLETSPDRLRDALVRQVTGAVRWVECMERLIERKPDHFLELGPGKVLSGLLRQIDRTQSCQHVHDTATLAHAIGLMNGERVTSQGTEETARP